MTPEAPSRIEELFHAAVEIPLDQRTAWLKKACGADGTLQREIIRLLDADSRTQLPIDAPPLTRGTWAGDLIGQRSAILPAGYRIGSYEVGSLIASGGMGNVYEAVQSQPRRTVALKLLRASFASPAELRRFQYEVELLGRLQHPHIAQIFEAGVHQDGLVSLLYFAMERIEGARHLLDHAKSAQLQITQRLALFLKVCEAVQHGHQRGVVHRDLKPSNILVNSAGEPKVIDYGVARALDADMRSSTLRTLPSEFVGTLQYMAPEQLRADPSGIDTRCDVYALGLILFELLTERRPFDISQLTWTQAIKLIEDHPAPSAATINRALRGDLSTIIAKALEKDRERRYGAVGDLAADIRRHLAHEPIAARPPSLFYQARKFAARRRALVAAMAVSIASLVAGTALALRYAADANAERIRTQQNANRINLVRGFLESMLTAGNAENAGPRVSMLEAIDLAAANIPVTIEQDPKVYGDLQSAVGRAYVRMNQGEKAVAHLQAAIDARGITDGDPSVELATAIIDLAWNFTQPPEVRLRQWNQARDMFARALGPDHPYVAAVISYMAADQFYQNNLPEGERLARESIHQLERTGKTHGTEYGYSLTILADILARTNRFEEAEKNYRTALTLQREVRGPRHPDVAFTLKHLADLLEKTGRQDEAKKLRREGLEIMPKW